MQNSSDLIGPHAIFPKSVKCFCNNPYSYAHEAKLVVEHEIWELAGWDHYNVGLVKEGLWQTVNISGEQDFYYYSNLTREQAGYISFHGMMENRPLTAEVLREIVNEETTDYMAGQFFKFEGDQFWEHEYDDICKGDFYDYDCELGHYNYVKRKYLNRTNSEEHWRYSVIFDY